MTSPRFGGSVRHQRKNTLVWLVALASVLVTAPCLAQGTGADSLTGPDSAVGVPPDSGAVAPGDTLARPAPDSTAAPARPATPPPPVDSALGAACTGTAGGPPDLLLVSFRPTTTASERSVVAREVGGTLLGMSEHAAPGSWYLQVPGSAGDRSVADRLILLSPVLEVGTTRCRR